MASFALPTRPEGTLVKNGLPPSMLTPCMSDGCGCRKASTSLAVENCGILVSNLVDTRTVRASVGST